MAQSKLRRQPAEVRREQILDAAQAVMTRHGMHDATVAEIADVAGLGKGTVYLQFESKQDIAAGLRRRYVERIENEVRNAITDRQSGPQKLRAFVLAFATASTRDTDLHHLLFNDAGIEEADAFANLRTMFIDIVRSDGFPSTPEVAIDYAFGGLHAALIAAAHASPTIRSRALTQIVELVSRTLAV